VTEDEKCTLRETEQKIMGPKYDLVTCPQCQGQGVGFSYGDGSADPCRKCKGEGYIRVEQPDLHGIDLTIKTSGFGDY